MGYQWKMRSLSDSNCTVMSLEACQMCLMIAHHGIFVTEVSHKELFVSVTTSVVIQRKHLSRRQCLLLGASSRQNVSHVCATKNLETVQIRRTCCSCARRSTRKSHNFERRRLCACDNGNRWCSGCEVACRRQEVLTASKQHDHPAEDLASARRSAGSSCHAGHMTSSRNLECSRLA